MPDKIRVGVVGASAVRGWALGSHRPALAASSDFAVTAVAGSTAATAAAAAHVWGAAHSFADPIELINHPEVDLVVLAVVLPRRTGLIHAAVDAGKHVYCEWPLAKGLADAVRFRDAADTAGVRHAVGLQTRFHPAVRQLQDLVTGGWIGDPLSASMTYALSTPATWPERHRSLISTPNLSRLMVVGGHSLDVFRSVVGPFTEISATLATRVPFAILAETGERLPITTPDQILLTGTLESGAVASVHITTGSPAGAGYRLEIHGSEGRLIALSADDSLVGPDFTVYGSRGAQSLTELPLDEAYANGAPSIPVAARNVHRVYAGLAEAIRTGGTVEPNFDTAVEMHRLIAAVETSANDGHRVTLGPGRPGTTGDVTRAMTGPPEEADRP